MNQFNYDAAAELFTQVVARSRRGPLKFRRFPTSAEAIRYTVEELSEAVRNGTVMEVNETRFDAGAIRQLYDSNMYPLTRREAAPRD